MLFRSATNVQEAIQATYFGYLAAVKEQNGAAMSLGRTSTFLDCYAQRDLANGTFTEEEIQEFVDHFIMKLRLVKFARTPEYNALFAGDPTWVTESLGGMGVDGRTLVTRMCFRSLRNIRIRLTCCSSCSCKQSCNTGCLRQIGRAHV